MEQSWLCTAGAHSPHKPALSGWRAAGASPAGRHQDAPCDGHKGGQLNRLCGEKAFFLNWASWDLWCLWLAWPTVSYSRILFSFRNRMCKIHSNFPSLVIFSFSFLIQCFLFLGAALLVVDGSSLLLRIVPVFRNTIDSAFWTFQFAGVLCFVSLSKANLVLRGGLSL